MIDVHPPEHGIHGTRDFFVHLVTITIGLLIALGLEAGVEAVHHRHPREEAETLIRQEILNNLAQLREGSPVAVNELQQMNLVLKTIDQAPPAALHESEFIFHEAPMQNAAWRTAASTGVLSYMITWS